MVEKSLGKNATLNVIKQACSIFFPFISFAYCSRILGKEQLGVYSWGQSIIAYFLLIASLGIPNYAIREGAIVRNNTEKLHKFTNEVFSINIVMTLVAYIGMALLLIFNQQFTYYRIVIIIQSIQIILTTLGADWINSIFEDYYYIAVRYIIVQVSTLVALFLFVHDSNDLYVYTFISMMSNAGGNLFNFYYLKRRRLYPRLTFSLSLFKHIVPILILFANSVASVIYLNSDITMIGILIDNGATGIYTVSTKIYSMIKSLINAMVMVTVPRFSYYLAEKMIDKYRNTLKNIADILIVVTIPLMVGMLIEASKILEFVAGINYLSGTTVVRILSLAILFATFSCFFSYAILLPNRLEKYFLISTSVAAVMNIGLNLVLIPMIGINGAALTTLLAEIIVFSITLYCSLKTVRFRISKKNILTVVVSSAALSVVCLSIDRIQINRLVLLILDVVIGATVYFGLLCLMKNDIGMSVIKIVCNKVKSRKSKS